MLDSVTCPRFKDGRTLDFNTGLNVILGDDAASNSIGKSSALMVLDFVFGGSDLLKLTPEILQHLGHHYYSFVFSFENKQYRYRRATDRPDIIFECDDNHEPSNEVPLKDYTEFLRSAYNIPDDEALTFRQCVSPFSRVWGKGNLNVKKPLAVVQREPEAIALNRLAKLFGRYHVLRSLEQSLTDKELQATALSRAMSAEFIPKITKRSRQSNEAEVGAIDTELDELRETLAKFAVNVREVANRETIELTQVKDSLLRERFHVSARLTQVEGDVSTARAPSSAKLERLFEFFPNVNKERLEQIEGFHTGIAGILRKELLSERRRVKEHLRSIDEEISTVDAKLAKTLSNVDAPSTIIDRAISLSAKRSELEFENLRHDDAERLRTDVKDAKQVLDSVRQAEFERITARVNGALRQLVTELSGSDRESPRFYAAPRRHSLDHDADKGTGTAYATLLIFDLVMLNLTPLPFVLEDSLLFKNIENTLVSSLLQRYAALDKQVFIAIDEPTKFGDTTSVLLAEKAVVQLSQDSLLYDTDWRNESVH